MIVERFAPSPTGPLHLGHAFSALTAWEACMRRRGQYLLRIEDIDQSRARPHWEAGIFKDLHWLGLEWPQPVMRQSQRLDAYDAALQALWDMGLLYVCTCSRRDIDTALSAPQGGPATGPDGVIYPGTCRGKTDSATSPVMSEDAVLRLCMSDAVEFLYKLDDCPGFEFSELGRGPRGETGRVLMEYSAMPEDCGDIVIARRGMGTSYHLSVVVDDADQGVSHVTRGQDLFEATKIHVILQKLLGLPTPVYRHHTLIRDEDGKRLAKRDDARSLAKFRADGATPGDIRRMVGLG